MRKTDIFRPQVTNGRYCKYIICVVMRQPTSQLSSVALQHKPHAQSYNMSIMDVKWHRPMVSLIMDRLGCWTFVANCGVGFCKLSCACYQVNNSVTVA